MHCYLFFYGENKDIRANETRILIPSIHSKKYDSCPAMSANKITSAILFSLDNDIHDFYLVNYANADMVGHSGNLDATIEAIKIFR